MSSCDSNHDGNGIYQNLKNGTSTQGQGGVLDSIIWNWGIDMNLLAIERIAFIGLTATLVLQYLWVYTFRRSPTPIFSLGSRGAKSHEATYFTANRK